MHDPIRPVAKRIVGYCDPLAPAAGTTLTVHVSAGDEGDRLTCELVRLMGPGTPDSEPPYEVLRSIATETVAAHRRLAHPGSAMTVQSGQAPALTSVPTVLSFVHPTCEPRRRQALVCWGDPWSTGGLAVHLDEELRPALTISAETTQTVTAPAPLPVGQWSAVMAGQQSDGRLALRVFAASGDPRGDWSVATRRSSGAPELVDTFVVAARQTSEGNLTDHFTGLLEAVTVLAAPLDPALTTDLLLDGNSVLPRTWTALDFTPRIDSPSETWSVVDRGPNHLRATLHNMPMRAVPGVRWTGAVHDWREAPNQYAALHFFADALEDCEWPADWSVHIPSDTVSGFYAARVTNGDAVDLIPFFVRPAAPSGARVLLVAPTATYAAYANSRFWWEDPIQELVQDRLVELGAEEQYLVTHPELGLSNYDEHLDGTPVCYSSRRRPNLNMRPGHVRGEGYASDLHLVAWLDRSGVAYDVATDEDWHFGGERFLEAYDVVITGTHPEYVSLAMLDSGVSWVGGGGRLMYMGGNGFNSNVAFDAKRPWIIENRRVELWEADDEWRVARAHNSVDGERGGAFPASGRRPAALIGVESATMGFDRSYPYHLTEARHRPDVAFASEGIAGPVLGARGDNGGVVGQEWDNAAGIDLGPGHVILGSSRDHSLIPPLFGAMRADYHADLVLYLRGPGAVFSVSSMAWAAELSQHDYRNDVARMSDNVLRRFLDPTRFGEGEPA